jgi:hypothetical protein
MTPYAWFILGAIGASLLWMYAIAWVWHVLATQAMALDAAQISLCLYRETQGHSDAQIRALLDQNERLARQLIEAKAQCAASGTLTTSFRPDPWLASRRDS